MPKKNTVSLTEVLVPIWVLKAKVEQDWEAFKLTNLTHQEISIMDEDDDDEAIGLDESPIGFPETDSTAKCIEILEKYDIYFSTKTGDWE